MTSIRVDFICTAFTASTASDKHRPKLLGQAQVSDDGTVVFESRGPSLSRDGRGRPRHSNTFTKIDRKSGAEYAAWRAFCPSCPLHVEWRRTRAETIARAAADEARSAGRRVAPFNLSKAARVAADRPAKS